MPIPVRCPNEACAKSFRVQDAASGRAGKCPYCGTRIMIPSPGQAAVHEPVSSSAAPTVLPSDGAGPRAAAASAAAPAPPVAAPQAPTFAPGPPTVATAASTAGVVRFEAIGEAWGLFRQHIGVWVLAAFITAIGGTAVQFAVFLLSMPMSLMGGVFFGGVLSPLMAIGSLGVALTVWGVFLAGMYRMALNQIDGHPVHLKDLISGSDLLPSVALASFLAGLATFAGILCLVIPGFVIAGMLMFTLPLVVDARLKGVEAIGASWKTLKDQWLVATLFMLVLWALQIAGMLLCGLGHLVTFPIAILSMAILYRSFFPRGGAPAKPVLQGIDPDFGPVAVATRPRGRIPVWAWLVAVAGLLTPPAIVSLVFAALILRLHSMAPRDFQAAQKRFQEAFRDMEKRQPRADQPAMPPGPNFGGLGGQGIGLDGRGIVDVKGALASLKGNVFQQQAAAEWLTVTKPAPDEPRRAEVAAALAPLLDSPFVRREGVAALTNWATRDQVPILVAALDNEDDKVRVQAEEALRRLKDERGLAALAAHRKGQVAPDAAPPAKLRLGQDAPAAIKKFMERPGEELPEKPANPRQRPGGLIPIDAASLLADLSNEDDGVRRGALDRLARTAPDPGHHDEVIKALEPLLSDARAALRAAAVKALSAWANEDDLPALIRPVDDEDPGVRRQAIAGLGRFKDVRAGEPVARHLADPDVSVRNEVGRTLVRIGAIAEGEVIKYLDADDTRVRERACQVLQVIGTKDSVPALARAAASRSPVSRAAQAALTAIAARNRKR